jgi:hypothetical protein
MVSVSEAIVRFVLLKFKNFEPQRSLSGPERKTAENKTSHVSIRNIYVQGPED